MKRTLSFAALALLLAGCVNAGGYDPDRANRGAIMFGIGAGLMNSARPQPYYPPPSYGGRGFSCFTRGPFTDCQ